MRLTLIAARLSAGDNANEFEAVRFPQLSFRPFTSVEGKAVVLDKDTARMQAVALDQLSDGSGSARICDLSIQPNIHEATSA